jgi:hypothetical protein
MLVKTKLRTVKGRHKAGIQTHLFVQVDLSEVRCVGNVPGRLGPAATRLTYVAHNVVCPFIKAF